jgi:formylglycine-generating enzyme required for sulfatase activity
MKYVTAFLACASVWIGFSFLLAAIGLKGYFLWALLFIVLLPAVWKGVLALFNTNSQQAGSSQVAPSRDMTDMALGAMPTTGGHSSDDADTHSALGKELEMSCYKCGKTLVAGVQFCPHCGKGQTQKCPQCGAVQHVRDKFCVKCGVDIELNALRMRDAACAAVREAHAARNAKRLDRAVQLCQYYKLTLDTETARLTADLPVIQRENDTAFRRKAIAAGIVLAIVGLVGFAYFRKGVTQRAEHAAQMRRDKIQNEEQQRIKEADNTAQLNRKIADPQYGDTITMNLNRGEQLELVWIVPGRFMMGEDEEYDIDKPAHQVILTKGFWMGKYEVTQGQWARIIGNNPSQFEGARNPVECVSWDDCRKFLNELNALVGRRMSPRIVHFRLPTEAEWEYTGNCR